MDKELLSTIKAMSIRDKRRFADKIAKLIEDEVTREGGETQAEWYLSVMGEILGRDVQNTRDRDFVYARVVISVCLAKDGWSEPQIGRVLHKNHATIHHYKQIWDCACEFPKGYPDLIWLHREFKKRIEDAET